MDYLVERNFDYAEDGGKPVLIFNTNGKKTVVPLDKTFDRKQFEKDAGMTLDALQKSYYDRLGPEGIKKNKEELAKRQATPEPETDSGFGLGPAPSPPGSKARKKLEAQIAAAIEARREAEAKAKDEAEPKSEKPAEPTPEEPKPAEPKPTLDPKLKADLDKFAPKINQDWAASNERLARVELARAQQRAAGKSVFDKEFRKTEVNPIMYKQPSVEKEAYEVVLDYLLSEGHADTVEEAHYVMMQLDSEYIQSIVEDSAPIPNIPTPTPTEKPKDKKKPPADTKIPDRSGYGPEEGGVYDREVRVPPNSYGDLRFPPNQRFNRGLGGPPPNTNTRPNTRPNTDPTTNTKPKPRKPLISLYPGQKGDGLMGPYIQFGNTRLGIPNISPFRPDK